MNSSARAIEASTYSAPKTSRRIGMPFWNRASSSAMSSPSRNSLRAVSRSSVAQAGQLANFLLHTLHGWSLSVFVTAIADYLCQVARFREDSLDNGKIAGVKREAKNTGVFSDVLRYAEPRADDDAGHRRTVQNITDTDI